MNVPGPIPKDPVLRQRRNRVATRATLSVEGELRRHTPQLPRGHDWHKLTRAWWHDVWASPMAPEFLQADVHGLYMLAELIDRFWVAPSPDLAKEIRLERQCFGLTPIDRRRLQWEVERVEQVKQKKRHSERGAQAPVEDPRKALRLVS